MPISSDELVEAFLPLRPADLQVLLVLTEGPRHGYGLMKAVEEQSGGRVRLEVGSLYRLIGRMLDAGLVEEAPVAPKAAAREPRGERRRYYRITPLGRRAAGAELERLRRVLAVARTLPLGSGQGRP